MDKEPNLEHIFLPCKRCGQTLSMFARQKRISRNLPDADVCRDCRDVASCKQIEGYKRLQRKHPTLGQICCVIYPHDLNEDWLPIDDEGNLFMPGERICGLKDCVSKAHVIPPVVKTVSNIDLILGMHEMQQHNKKARTK